MTRDPRGWSVTRAGWPVGPHTRLSLGFTKVSSLYLCSAVPVLIHRRIARHWSTAPEQQGSRHQIASNFFSLAASIVAESQWFFFSLLSLLPPSHRRDEVAASIARAPVTTLLPPSLSFPRIWICFSSLPAASITRLLPPSHAHW